MKRAIVITDLTRMQEGRVCIAGYDENGKCIRPVLPPPGIYENSLYANGQPIIFPFALVEFDLIPRLAKPPHTEDHHYHPASVKFLKCLDENQKRTILVETLFESTETIFEVPVLCDYGHYIMEGQGVRSLGTIQPKSIKKATHDRSPEGKWRYRVGFVDGKSESYWLTITDLAWRYYCDRQREKGRTPQQISTELTSALKMSEVFLRIGLARGWARFPNRCYLQVTGVYTFPDYLKGQTFADLRPQKS